MISIKEAKIEFIKEFKKYGVVNVPGGINGVGIGSPRKEDPPGLSVRIESSKEILEKIPKEFMGFPVYAEIIGEIKALDI